MPEIGEAVARYHRTARQTRDAPRMSTIIHSIECVQRDAKRLASSLAALGRWERDVFDPSALLSSAEGEALARQVDIADTLEGSLEDRLETLTELAVRQVEQIKRAVPGYSRGGARDASPLVDPYPRFSLVMALADAPHVEDPREGLPEKISARDIQRARIEGLRTASEVKAALGELEEAGWLRAASSPIAPTGGRPKLEWMVNPALGDVA